MDGRQESPTPILRASGPSTPAATNDRPSFLELCPAHPGKQDFSMSSILEPPLSKNCMDSELNIETISKFPPASEGVASSIFPSSDSSEQSLEYLEQQKLKFTLAWLDLVTALFVGSDVIHIYFFFQASRVAQIFLIAQVASSVMYIGLLAWCHKKENREKLWMPLLFMEVKFVAIYWYLSQDESFYYNESASSFKEFTSYFNPCLVFGVIGFFQNTIIVLHSLKGSKLKRRILYLVIFLTALIQFAQIRTMEFPSEFSFPVRVVAVSFIFFSLLVLDVSFAVCIHFLMTIQSTLYKLEVEENRKFTYMFNAIQDGVVLLEEDAHPKFINSIALKICDDAVTDSQGDHSLNVIEQPIFYPYQSPEGAFPDRAGGQSLADLAKLDHHTTGGVVFTTSKAVYEGERMDAAQQVIEEHERAGGQKSIFFAIKLVPIKNLKKKPFETMIQIQDISLRVYSQYLKVERQYMSLMNSTVSHEMRNPLNALIAEIQQQKGHIINLRGLGLSFLDPQHKTIYFQTLESSEKSLSIAENSTKMLKFNVEDILALPQLKQGKLVKNYSPVRLASAIEDIVEMTAFQARQKNLKVTIETRPEVVLRMDEQRFQQVLLNYLSNAIKFTGNGEVKVVAHVTDFELSFAAWKSKVERIWNNFEGLHLGSSSSSESLSEGSTLSAQDQQRFVEEQEKIIREMLSQTEQLRLVLTLIDTGVGLTITEQARLFKMFGTIKRTRAVNTRGVGLGLSISKMICEEFGGQVAVFSRPGVGSAFVASMVIEKVEIIGNNTIQRKSEALLFSDPENIKKQNQVSNTQILIVDDEAYNCEVLRAMLTSLGIAEERLSIHLGGRSALTHLKETFESQTPYVQLVLTDLSMPMMDGYKLIKKILKESELAKRRPPPIIALTGHTEPEFINRALECGASKVFSKPLSQSLIRQILQDYQFEF